MTDTMTEVRDRLVLPLDLDDLDDALAMARTVAPWFGVAKVGYELYATAGPEVFARLHDLGLRIFCDLKLHDIPTTVERGAAALARHGLDFVNAHAAGGVDMLRAFNAGITAGAAAADVARPVTLAVTVLTSDPDAGAFDVRLAAAAEGGCDGVVCSGLELDRVRAAGLRAMVPGVRPAGSALDDQSRVVTPGDAVRAGADWIIVGRPVTRAADPAAVAAAIADAVAGAIAQP
ncbi:MAG: orotidine-5'-phosphate decarboxylase [Acidimicrobiia bacterium]